MTAAANTTALDGVDVFIANGWTRTQWQTLYDRFNASNEPGALAMKLWLRHPRHTFDNPTVAVTPDTAVDAFARHGFSTATVLLVMGVGASERFTKAFLGPRWLDKNATAATTAWQYATSELGLPEPQATGWALTGFLEGNTGSTPRLTAWLRLGPTAYLWILAGFTLAEASGLQQGGTNITEQQLRVMAALNGVVLPDDV